jgi:hypothetical protein
LNSRRAQASVEFLIILAISLVVITVIALMAQQQITTIQQQKATSDTQNSLMDLDSAAREVYAEGAGSTEQVYVELPSDYQPNRSYVGNNSIVIYAGDSAYADTEDFNLSGSLPAASGGTWVWVMSEGSQVRIIGAAMIQLNPTSIYVQMNANSTANASFTLTNIWTNAINVSTTTTWSSSDVTMSGVPQSFSLAQDTANQTMLTFTADTNATGFYTGQIYFNASDANGSTDSGTLPITVEVTSLGQQTSNSSNNSTNSSNGSIITGPLVTSIWQSPAQAAMLQPLSIFATVNDTIDITSCSIDANYANNWTLMAPVNSTYGQSSITVMYNYTAGFLLGPNIVRIQCMDNANLTGPMAYYYFSVAQNNTLGPIVTNMENSAASTLTNVTVNATATDIYTGDNNIAGCIVQVDKGAWVNATPLSGAYNSSPTLEIAYNIGMMSPGYHTVNWQCTDSVGNVGGIYNESFGVVTVDLMLDQDVSGSMADNVTNLVDDNQYFTTSTSWVNVDNLTVNVTNGINTNTSIEIKSGRNCLESYNITINGTTLISGNQTSTSYATITNGMSIAGYAVPFNVELWLKTNASGCTAYSELFSIQQAPSKIVAATQTEEAFLGDVSSSTQAGLVYFSTTATTDKELALLTPTNLTSLDNAIAALVNDVEGNTCIECGFDNGVAELTSSRSRANATKVIILLTDGMGNVGNSLTGADLARSNNVTIYTIGIGDDANGTELLNDALLTYGKYYFAPNASTLTQIFASIGH